MSYWGKSQFILVCNYEVGESVGVYFWMLLIMEGMNIFLMTYKKTNCKHCMVDDIPKGRQGWIYECLIE